ncbi:hypothetical protein [Bosea sp. (in: a-proteobacteria)]|uniref:hypothetical protein n=1 Tax=Bosea sp. (in: a-proteobacteria) TaxID=1871050 RepID=UPI003B3A8EA8
MAERHTNWRSLTIVVSLGILIAVELFGVALVAGWALAGWLELGTLFEYAMMAIFSGFAGYGMLHLMRRVLKVEHLTTVD